MSFFLRACSSFAELKNILSAAERRSGKLKGRLYKDAGPGSVFSSSKIRDVFLSLCGKERVDPQKAKALYRRICSLYPDIKKDHHVKNVVQGLFASIPKKLSKIEEKRQAPYSLRLTPECTALLQTYPAKINELINRSIQNKALYTETTIDAGQRSIACIQEADGSFSVTEKKPSRDDDVCILGERTVVITPTQDPLKKTITIKVQNSYVKLRNIDVRRRSEEIQKPTYKKDDWISIGSGTSAILISASQVNDKRILEHVRQGIDTVLYPLAHTDVPVHYLFENDESTLPEIFASVFPDKPITGDQEKETLKEFRQLYNFKTTCIMTPAGELLPVFSRIIGKGTCKIVKEIIALQRIPPEQALHLVVAKNVKGIQRTALLKEASISEQLRKGNVPYMLQILAITRANSTKAGLLMEFCSGGSLYDYVKNHFDLATKKVLPEFREQHRQLCIQVAKGLSAMHALGLVHSDIKLANILLIKTHSGYMEVRISDFGLTHPLGQKITYPPGTFPPPEEQKELGLQVERKATTGIPMEGIPLTPAVDAWAFGLLLFDVMHKRRDISNAMFYEKSADQIELARDSLLQVLDSNDAIDSVIAQLLDQDPKRRISVGEALRQLQQAT